MESVTKGVEQLLQESEIRFMGYSYKDYIAKFGLTEEQISNMSFLDYAGALNGFTHTMHMNNHRSVCVDPLFDWDKVQLEGKIELATNNLTRYLEEHCDKVNVDRENIQQEVDMRRREAIKAQEAREALLHAKVYQAQELPSLNFPEKKFDMALCSHFLFTYSSALTLDFHIKSVLELARVAYEVRIFPLVNSFGDLSEHIGPVLQALQDNDYSAQILQVDSQIQKVGNAMLVIGTTECAVEEGR